MTGSRDPGAIMSVVGMFAFALMMASCTITETYGEDGARIERSLSFGPARLPDPGDGAVTIRQRGLGAGWGNGQGAIGYFSLRLARAVGPCGAILVLPGADAAARARALLPPTSRILVTEI